jgi:phosphoribosylformimino-5-aminoimidazole carboxamide ribotide isomerase
VYVADLDAIGGLAPQETAIAELRRAAPHVEFWVDAGFTDAAAASQPLRRGVVPVLGTESLASEAALAPALESVGPRHFVLSLDYRQGAFIGPPGVIQKVELWPDRIILMTLDRVGMTAGPDVAGLRSLVARAGARRVFAAGGVRGAEDIAALRARGVAGALVASALHDGRLTPATLDACLRDGD